MKAINHNIRELRELKKISQKDLASFLGVSSTAVVHWENGVTCPNRENTKKLCSFFNISQEQLEGEVVNNSEKVLTLNEFPDEIYEMFCSMKCTLLQYIKSK